MIIELMPEQAAALWPFLKHGITATSASFTDKSSLVVAEKLLDGIVCGLISVWAHIEYPDKETMTLTGFALTHIYSDPVTTDRIVFLYLVYTFVVPTKEFVHEFLTTLRQYANNINADRILSVSYKPTIMDRYLNQLDGIDKVGSIYSIDFK